jgi:hypothetical protein
MLQKEQESSALALGSAGCAAHSVDVVFGIIRRVILNDPVNLREIKASLGNVCA